jgi:hypothetical protein
MNAVLRRAATKFLLPFSLQTFAYLIFIAQRLLESLVGKTQHGRG